MSSCEKITDEGLIALACAYGQNRKVWKQDYEESGTIPSHIMNSSLVSLQPSFSCLGDVFIYLMADDHLHKTVAASPPSIDVARAMPFNSLKVLRLSDCSLLTNKSVAKLSTITTLVYILCFSSYLCFAK